MKKQRTESRRTASDNPTTIGTVSLWDVSWRDVQRQVGAAKGRRQAYITHGARRMFVSVKEWLDKPVVAPAATG